MLLFKIWSLIERSKAIYKYLKNTHISALANFLSSTIKNLRDFLVKRITVLWNVTPCILVARYKPSEGKCCLSYVRRSTWVQRTDQKYRAFHNVLRD